MRSVALFRVAGVVHQKLTGNIRAFSAVNIAFALTAGGNGTFTVERMSVFIHRTNGY